MTEPLQLSQWAQKNGYSFSAHTKGFQTDGASKLDSFRNLEKAQNHIVAECQTRNFEMLDFTIYYAGDAITAGYREQTVLLLPDSASEFTDFEIFPLSSGGYSLMESLGIGGLKLTNKENNRTTQELIEAFSKHYRIYAGGILQSIANNANSAEEYDLATVSEICKPKLLRFLTKNPGWFIESQGNHLVLWTPDKLLSCKERSELLCLANELLDILNHAKHESSLEVITIENTMDINPRKVFSILGGGVIGFFIGTFCAMIFVFSTTSKLSFLAFPVFIFLGLAIGLFIGKTISKSS
jgi:hypothetical protein